MRWRWLAPAGALLVGALGVSADALLAALERGLSRGRTA